MYHYAPLTRASSFRLIRLSENATTESISLEISKHDLRQPPSYVALSYRWGEDNSPYSIFINGAKAIIRKSLWHFLRQITVETDQTSFWIDAICINQDDVLERNQQVAKMSVIYSKATRVVVWLSHDPLVEHCLNTFSRPERSDFLEDEDEDFRDMVHASSIAVIGRLGYWKRAWIVQELALGHDIQLKALGVSIPTRAFRENSASLVSAPFEEQPVLAQTQESLLSRIDQLHEEILSEREFNLAEWLSQGHHAQCADERDKIYSLYGLYQYHMPWIPLQPPIDYQKPFTTAVWDCCFMLLFNHYNDRQGSASDKIVDLSRLDVHLYGWLDKMIAEGAMPNRLLTTLETYVDDPTVYAEYKVLAKVFARTLSLLFLTSSTREARGWIKYSRCAELAAMDFAAGLIELSKDSRPWKQFSSPRSCACCKQMLSRITIRTQELRDFCTEKDMPKCTVRRMLISILRASLGDNHALTLRSGGRIAVDTISGDPSSEHGFLELSDQETQDKYHYGKRILMWISSSLTEPSTLVGPTDDKDTGSGTLSPSPKYSYYLVYKPRKPNADSEANGWVFQLLIGENQSISTSTYRLDD